MSDQIIFIPVRLNEDQSDLGAIISINDLGNYVALSDAFQAQKKTVIQTILEKPYTKPTLINIPSV